MLLLVFPSRKNGKCCCRWCRGPAAAVIDVFFFTRERERQRDREREKRNETKKRKRIERRHPPTSFVVVVVFPSRRLDLFKKDKKKHTDARVPYHPAVDGVIARCMVCVVRFYGSISLASFEKRKEKEHERSEKKKEICEHKI